MDSRRYTIEIRRGLWGGPANYTAFVRRPRASSIAIGVGCGTTLAEAVQSACSEVRERRRRGEFRD